MKLDRTEVEILILEGAYTNALVHQSRMRRRLEEARANAEEAEAAVRKMASQLVDLREKYVGRTV